MKFPWQDCSSYRARGKEFAALTDEKAKRIEGIYADTFTEA